MILQIFHLFSTLLIEFMGGLFLLTLVVRYICFKSGQVDQIYFNGFARAVEKLLEEDRAKVPIDDIDTWFNKFLDQVTAKLPSRRIRFGGKSDQKEPPMTSFRNQNKVNIQEYSDGRRSIVHSLKQQSDIFKSSYQPNFVEVTSRILERDNRWKKVLGIIPIDTVSRFMDILPGLFIVGGIFGTFIGITSALPKIATIDLSNLDSAAPILNSFVESVAFSMNTSIAGIVFSVGLTLLNTIFPIEAARRDVRKNLQRSFQFIWNRIHWNSMSYAEERMVNTLVELLKVAKEGQSPRGQAPPSNIKKVA